MFTRALTPHQVDDNNKNTADCPYQTPFLPFHCPFHYYQHKQLAKTTVIIIIFSSFVPSVVGSHLCVCLSANQKTKQFNNRNNSINNKTSNIIAMSASSPSTPRILSKVLDQLSWRLPKAVRPVRYDLHIHPDFAAQRFSGRVAIQVVVSEPTDFIAVHANKLTVSGSQLERLSSGDPASERRNVNIAQAFAQPQFEYWITEPAERLAAGDYVLTLQYNGSLTDKIVGFYQSSYLDPVSKQKRSVLHLNNAIYVLYVYNSHSVAAGCWFISARFILIVYCLFP